MAGTDRISKTDRLRIDRQSGHLHRSGYQLTVESGPDRGRTVPIDGTVFVGSHEACALRLTDTTVSRYHLELTATAGGLRVRDLESTNGSYLAGARIESVVVDAGARLDVGATTLRVDLVDEDLGEAPAHRTSFGSAVGESLAMRRVFSVLERVSKGVVPIVLCGETGTGKGVLAEGVHLESGRSSGPFVVLDCSSLAHGLVESELFGHVKGAFTGALTERLGAFREADGGTLLLDGVTGLPIEHQPKLLRAIETGMVKAVGSDAPQKIDVRVVATANDLDKAVAEGRLRRDLYFRLAVVTVWVPPLRERIEDLPLLCRRFLSEQRRPDFNIPKGLLEQMQSHSWPGNVRELRNTVERALIGFMPSEQQFHASATRPATAPPTSSAVTALTFKEAKEQILEAFEKEYLTALLEQCNGNLSEVARSAGINRNHVRKLAERHGLLVSTKE